MAKDPAFLFYSSDFLTGTFSFSSKEKGQYITILCVMHQAGRLTVGQMKAACRESILTTVLAKFKLDDTGKYYNERLEQETEKRKKFSQSRKNSLSITNGDMVHVYLLFDPKRQNFKIGSSKYPGIRLSDVQKKNPSVELFWKTEILVERIKEKELQDYFKDKKVIHDWFDLDPDDIDFIKNYFRTGTNNTPRTELRTENENVITTVFKKEDPEKKWHTTPGSESMDLPLPDIKYGVIVELFLFTKNTKISRTQVLGLWKIFKVQNFCAEKYYATVNEVYRHFINWCKTQTVELDKQGNGSMVPQTTYKKL